MVLISTIIIAVLILIDQLSKYLVVNSFDIGEVKNLLSIGGHEILSLTHVRNSGAAWSIMKGNKIFLIVLPLLILGFLVYLIYAKKISSKLETLSLSLIIAGGIGNLIDRIRLSEVVDFVKTDFISFPVFNFADICVVIGTGIFCVYNIIVVPLFKKDNKVSEEVKSSDDNDNSETESNNEQI